MLLQNFVERHAEEIERIETAGSLAWWHLATTGDEKYAKEMEEAKIALRKLYSSPEELHYLQTHALPDSPLLKREIALMLLAYRENQIPQELIQQTSRLESEIETIYTNFRPIVKGASVSNNDLKKILVESRDPALRKEAWEASKLIGEAVEADLLKLVALRNESAVKAGFVDYYSMRLELQELEEKRLFEIFDQLEKLTNPHWQKYKSALDEALAQRYGIPTSELMPWHYQDPFFQEAPRDKIDFDRFYAGKDLVALAHTFYKAVGFEIDDILARSDLYEREQKNQHAFCNCIDRRQDIRMLCNLRDNEYWMGTLLHELGHAVYDKYIDQALPYLLRAPAHTHTTEASAMLFGRLSLDGAFLQHFCGLEATTAQEIDLLAKNQIAAHLLVFARWTMVMAHFERAMYQQPGIDLNATWWKLVERFQGLHAIPGRDKPDWAAKLHLACAPVYYHNYLLGEMTASQLLHHLKDQLKESHEPFCTSSKVGDYLKDRLYALGAQYPWEETLRQATGEGLNPHYFSQDLL